MNRGDISVYAKLAYMHEKGLGTPIDYRKAFDLYHIAVDNGYTSGHTKLGYMYEKGLNGKKDLTYAFLHYKNGISHNAEEAYRLLADMYDNEPGAPGDKNTYLKLAKMYEDGELFSQDYKKSLKFYTKANAPSETIARITKNISESIK